MTRHLAAIALVVRDYDEAIAFYVGKLGFDLIEDTRLSETKRWVLVAPPGSRETRLLLAKADNPDQKTRIGNQTGGRVFLFLHADDFARDYEKTARTRHLLSRIAAPRVLRHGRNVRRSLRQQVGPDRATARLGHGTRRAACMSVGHDDRRRAPRA